MPLFNDYDLGNPFLKLPEEDNMTDKDVKDAAEQLISKERLFITTRARNSFDHLEAVAKACMRDDMERGSRAVKSGTIEDTSLKMTLNGNYFRLISEAIKTASDIDREERFLIARIKMVHDDMNKE